MNEGEENESEEQQSRFAKDALAHLQGRIERLEAHAQRKQKSPKQAPETAQINKTLGELEAKIETVEKDLEFHRETVSEDATALETRMGELEAAVKDLRTTLSSGIL